MRKGNPDNVPRAMALKALELAGGDRRAAYSQCIRMCWQLYGRLAPSFDNADLQAFYDKELGERTT